MVLLLRDSDMAKAEILAAMEAMKASFTTYHNELRKSLSDFESRLEILVPLSSATTAAASSHPPHLHFFPYTPIDRSSVAGCTTALQPGSSASDQLAFPYPSPYQPPRASSIADFPPAAAISPHLCPVDGLQKLPPSLPSSTKPSPTLITEACLSLPHLLTENSPPTPTDHRPLHLKSQLTPISLALSLDNLVECSKEEDTSTPTSCFPVVPRCLLKCRTGFFGRAVVTWAEEPPGSLFCEFNTSLKFPLVDQAIYDSHSADENHLFNFGASEENIRELFSKAYMVGSGL